MYRDRAGLAASVLVACLIAAGAQGQEQQKAPALPTLAVNMLEARGVSADEAATLTEVLRSELSATQKFAVMERGQMDNILKEQGFQLSGACKENSCLVEMGQLLGAQQLVAGSIGKVGKAYSINVRVVSVQTGTIVNSVSHTYTGPIESLLTTEMSVVAKKLAGVVPNVSERVQPKNRVPIIVASVGAGVVVVGGVAAYLVVKKRRGAESTPPAQVQDESEVFLAW
jgi:TolB-like protein